MIVDAHTHLWQHPDQLGPQITAQLRQRYSSPGETLDASPSAHEEATAVVDAALVLGFRSVMLDASVPAKLVAAYVNPRRDRLFGFAGIDPLEDSALDQLDALPALGLSGVVISPAEQGYNPSDAKPLRLLEKCQALRLPVYVHMGNFYARDSRLEFASPVLLDEIPRSFPNLKLIITNVGYPWIDQTLILLGKHRNVFTDLSDVISRPSQLYNVILHAYQTGVLDRLLLASDFPLQTPQQAIEAIYNLTKFAQSTGMPNIPREKLRSIVERDTLAALGLRTTSPTGGKPGDESANPRGLPTPAALRPFPTRLSTG